MLQLSSILIWVLAVMKVNRMNINPAIAYRSCDIH